MSSETREALIARLTEIGRSGIGREVQAIAAALRGDTAPSPEEWWAVYDADGKPCAAYPHKVQADVYASGFSKPPTIRPLALAVASPATRTETDEEDYAARDSYQLWLELHAAIEGGELQRAIIKRHLTSAIAHGMKLQYSLMAPITPSPEPPQ